jgi:hypothetical protein
MDFVSVALKKKKKKKIEKITRTEVAIGGRHEIGHDWFQVQVM